jgi:hypothetical protein
LRGQRAGCGSCHLLLLVKTWATVCCIGTIVHSVPCPAAGPSRPAQHPAR